MKVAKRGRGYNDAIVVANMRSASSFLISCLSGHPEIRAMGGEETEVLLSDVWRTNGDADVDVLRRYYDHPTISLTCAKITYVQFSREIADFIISRRLKVIHLTRENVIRWALSAVVNEKTSDERYGHFFEGMERPKIPRFTVVPSYFLGLMISCDTWQRRMHRLFEEISNEVLSLTYEDVVGREGSNSEGIDPEKGRAITDFLGVPYKPLTSDRRKGNIWPISEVIANWNEVHDLISHSDYMALLEGLG
jgi:hypothetical protein